MSNIIRTNPWPSQRERLSRLVDINDTPGDMAELDYTSAEPGDTRWMLPAFALAFAVVALVGIVKFRIWETLEATW